MADAGDPAAAQQPAERARAPQQQTARGQRLVLRFGTQRVRLTPDAHPTNKPRVYGEVNQETGELRELSLRPFPERPGYACVCYWCEVLDVEVDTDAHTRDASIKANSLAKARTACDCPTSALSCLSDALRCAPQPDVYSSGSATVGRSFAAAPLALPLPHAAGAAAGGPVARAQPATSTTPMATWPPATRRTAAKRPCSLPPMMMIPLPPLCAACWSDSSLTDPWPGMLACAGGACAIIARGRYDLIMSRAWRALDMHCVPLFVPAAAHG